MSQRIIRILGYEGNPHWVKQMLEESKLARAPNKTLFHPHGTVKELELIELEGNQRFSWVVLE